MDRKKSGATSNIKHSPPKTTSRNEAGWEGSLPRYENGTISISHLSVTHLFGSPPLCILTGTSMLLSYSPPGNSHCSGTPCSHMGILLQKNIKEKRGRGVSLGTEPAHGTLDTQ